MPIKEIPEINIPDIHIPQVFIPNYEYSNINVIGCNYYHRDTINTGNRNLLLDDPNGVISDCNFPSFIPLNYDAKNLIITEQLAPIQEDKAMPESKTTKGELPKPKNKDPLIPDCPNKNQRRVGEYTSEARTERIKAYRLVNNECITEYEEVTFVDSFLPSPSAALNVATISLIAAASPAILNLIKSASKTIFKKIFAKFNKGKDDKAG